METEAASPKTKNVGGRPRLPPKPEVIEKVLSSPEGQAAIAAAVANATPGIIEQLSKKLVEMRGGAEPGTLTSGDNDMISKLAMSMAEMANQSTGRKVLAPEEIERRARARTHLLDIMLRIHEQGLQPEYKLTSETYLNEVLLRPYENGKDGAIQQVEIFWTGIPNEAMLPVNDIAVEAFDAFINSIGGFSDSTKNDAQQPRWVTRGGLSIKGRGGHRRTVGTLGDSNAPNQPVQSVLDPKTPAYSDVVRKKSDPRDPTAPFVNVLGTIAPAAKQNAHGVEANR